MLKKGIGVISKYVSKRYYATVLHRYSLLVSCLCVCCVYVCLSTRTQKKKVGVSNKVPHMPVA